MSPFQTCQLLCIVYEEGGQKHTKISGVWDYAVRASSQLPFENIPVLLTHRQARGMQYNRNDHFDSNLQ